MCEHSYPIQVDFHPEKLENQNNSQIKFKETS